MTRLRGQEGLIGLGAALAASSCCLLPLVVVLLGLGSGAFMMTTMRWLCDVPYGPSIHLVPPGRQDTP